MNCCIVNCCAANRSCAVNFFFGCEQLSWSFFSCALLFLWHLCCVLIFLWTAVLFTSIEMWTVVLRNVVFLCTVPVMRTTFTLCNSIMIFSFVLLLLCLTRLHCGLAWLQNKSRAKLKLYSVTPALFRPFYWITKPGESVRGTRVHL
jgi:hypothetical protein